MGRLLLLISACLLTAGCMTDRELPGLRPKYATAEAAKDLVTPQLIKDCVDKLAKEWPNVSIIGNFSLSPRAAAKVGDLQLLPGGPNDEIVALVAPSSNKNLFGAENKGISGCSYRLQNNRLVFRAVHPPGAFGRVLFVNQSPWPASSSSE